MTLLPQVTGKKTSMSIPSKFEESQCPGNKQGATVSDFWAELGWAELTGPGWAGWAALAGPGRPGRAGQGWAGWAQPAGWARLAGLG